VSDEKTEQPTQKKLRDARKKGQVFKSKDITQALLFLTAVGVLSAGGPAFISQIRTLITHSLRPEMFTGKLQNDQILSAFGSAWLTVLLFPLALLTALTVVSAAASFLQVGPLFSAEVVQAKFERLNFIKGFQNVFFKPRTYLELLKNLVKFAVLGTLVYMAIRSSLRDIILTSRADALSTGRLAVSLMFGLLFKTGIAFLAMGSADFLIQRKLYWKELKMTKYEVKKEHKEEQGDPHMKHARRHMQQRLLAGNMVKNVPRADVVVVNPTHLAIAIEYDELSMNAPTITAKGQDKMAERIIALARSSNVPIMRNVPLAHSLFPLELGYEIPEDLYEAVAEVLNWVYQLAKSEEAGRTA
jgi:type III secretion YscU/HrpY family protein